MMRNLSRVKSALTPLLAFIAVLSIAGASQWMHLIVEHGGPADAAHTSTADCSHGSNETDHPDDHPERSPLEKHRHDCATCKMLALQTMLPGPALSLAPIAQPRQTALVPWSVEFSREPHLDQLPARAPPTARG